MLGRLFSSRVRIGNGAHRPVPPFRRNPLFEALEQRVLLSADPLALIAASGETLDVTVRTRSDSGTTFVDLVDTNSHVVIISRDLASGRLAARGRRAL